MPLKHTCLLLAGLAIGALQANAQSKPTSKALPHRSSTFKTLETDFATIPDSVQTSVYWYWISGNISKEGVVKDLEAMKKVGINRAFIGNIGLDEVPNGKVKMFSPEWWEITHAALKAATRLNIEIGIFNGPGWSQSGGPWVKPGQSMRYLTSSQTMVKGPMVFNQKLPVPKADFQDVKVIAYPVANDYQSDISALKPTYSSMPKVDSLDNLFDGSDATAVPVKEGKHLAVDVNVSQPYTLRSVTINTSQHPVILQGEVQAKNDTGYVTIRQFTIDRRNPALNTGFIPYGPATISTPATSATSFRVVFNKVSGNSGVAEIKFSSVPMVEDYLEKTLGKMWPTPHPFWTAYQWDVQPNDKNSYDIDPAKVQDISASMAADGTLNWNVPAGNWIIERTGMVPTLVTNSPAPKEGQGLEVDKMSKEHVAAHFDAFMGEILKRIPAADRKTWKVVVQDSYETGGQNWTDGLAAEFKQVYKYDPIPYLPVLQGKVVGSRDMSDRFLWDLRRLIADDVSYKYVGGLRDVSHKYGLHTWLENYGHWGYPGEFLQYGGQSDEIGGEFWSEGDLGDIENRAASSSAHIYGKTKVSAESFTAAGAPFGRYPAMFKKRGDRFFTEGINNTLLHVYVAQPGDDKTQPGQTAWFGVEFNRQNTWFYDMDVLMKYLKRCNMMLQQGRYVADAAYFIGEDAPKMTGVTDPALPEGYSFDYINGEVIKNRLSVKNGKFVLPNGITYSVLVLPKLETMRPELLVKIKELVLQGGVVLGPKPSRSPSLAGYPAADGQVQSLAAEMWGEGAEAKVHHYGKGMVLSGMGMEEAFKIVKAGPDFKARNAEQVLFIHRKLADGDMYFVSNQNEKPINFTGEFSIAGKQPELWDAITGKTRALPNYTQTATTTKVPMQLAPLESAFIIFRKPGKGGNKAKTNYPVPAKSISIEKPWTVSFDKTMRGPVKPIVFDTLADWSKSANDSIKYYSGTAWYRNSFKVEKLQQGGKYVIDLGLARSIAKVYVNGKEMGGVWTPPYRVDISKAVKAGENKLEVKVVNNWVNRLVGDSKMPVGTRPTQVIYGPDANTGLQQSGLLGPVKIDVIKY
ncbi:glycosyl hydrolase [Mucilaginibacter pedocola]|uniref:Glycoside hydrolase family 2 n=1 Tax=Mucilaginibacter pedocola TaxID=1792845 RepID=A0A1S9PJR6_9SPHI|nr:glycosyl hydrolase [Mucilaginibacter pedocola]OOQ61203.1 glycoside hydrolase family 2 [Mucilaginibacter pedocola]